MTNNQPTEQNIVHASFLKYLKEDFVTKSSWQHPTTLKVYEHEQINDVILDYKNIHRKNYAALYGLWVDAPRAEVARSFSVSSSTLKRRWEQAMSHLLLLLLFPELRAEELKIYQNSEW